MSRQADSTIKGFLYQFNKTLKEVLTSDEDQQILVEGIIEDIDIIPQIGENPIRAIQCKYHESSETFTLSLIYKPVLQMLEGCAKGISATNLVIFIHVKNPPQDSISLTEEQLREIIKTENAELNKIIDRTTGPVDLGEFISKLTIEFGPSISRMEEDVKSLLLKCFDKGTDVDGISYPNAINIISKLASEKEATKRKISKKALINQIIATKEIIFTKWVSYTNSRQKVFTAMKRTLSHSLGINSTKRYIYLCQKHVRNFDDSIVSFIMQFLEKYHCKAAHTNPPLFVIDADENYISQIVSRLYRQGIKANEGIAGDKFFLSKLLSPPVNHRSRLPQDADYRVRICSKVIFPDVLRQAKPNYLYVVADSIPAEWDRQDVCHHQMAVDNFEDLEYVFSLRGALNVQ